jgi:hypothetical protein
MQQPDFWTQSAEAMELSVEGNRLVAHAIADWVGGLWRRVTDVLTEMLNTEHRHLPPV